jgi:methyl-accepting chemotaxis protein
MRAMTIRSRMLMIFAVIALSQAIVAVIGLHGFRLSNNDLAEVYQDRLVPVSRLARINDLMHGAIEQLTIATISRPGPRIVQNYTAVVEKNLETIDRLAQDHARHVTGDEDRKLFSEWMTERDSLVSSGLKPAMDYLKAQAFDDAEDTLLGTAVKRFAAVQQRFDAIVANELRKAEQTHDAADRRYALTRNITIGSVMLALALCGAMALYVTRSITGPLAAMTQAMMRLAKRDLDVAIPAANRTDEVGHMAHAMLVFRGNALEARELQAAADAAQALKERRQAAMDQHIQEFGTSVAGVMASMKRSAETMRTAAAAMADSSLSTRVSAACAAEGATTADTNLTAVATAAEQMSASINEIGRQVSRATRAAGAAVERAGVTDEKVGGMAAAADRVGDVVRLITEIAARTNLLALNATIEAARAGEAGKGFAVVASEVKALAMQTARATEEITTQIAAIRAATSDAVRAARDVGSAIGEVDQVATAIAAAIEQQATTTRDIAASVQTVSTVTQQTATAIQEVSKIAEGTDAASNMVRADADQLAGEAETLQDEVTEFLRVVANTDEDRRAYERIAGNGAEALVCIPGLPPIHALIADMSRGGVSLRCDWQAEPGAGVQIKLPGAGRAVEARVVRASSGILAVMFRQNKETLPLVDRALEEIGKRSRLAAA